MTGKSTTTLKLSEKLRARVARIAKKSGRTPHSFMVEAIDRQTTREEHVEAFVSAALAADKAIEEGGEVYAADDVHAWLRRLAAGGRRSKPKPWRG